MKRLFISFAALAALISCVQENQLNPPQPLKVSINATAADTKTVLDENAVKWEDKDEIALVLSGAEKAVVKFATAVEGTEPVAEAVFTGTIDPESAADKDDAVLAVYPYSAVVDGEISFALPAEQTVGEDGSFASGLNLSSAALSLEDITKDGEADAQFKNALAILRFTLPADIASVTLTGTAPLAGKAPLTVVDGCLAVSEASEWQEADKIMSVYPKLPEGGQVYEAGKVYNLLVWPGEHTSLTLKMTDKDGCEYEKTVEGTFVFEASKFYTLTFNQTFGKEFSATLEGREFASQEQIAVALGELYKEVLTVTVEDQTAEISGNLPHTDEVVNGYALYPASVAETMTFELPSVQTPSSDIELYAAAVSSESLVAENAVLSFGSALATLEITVPAGVKSVSVSSSDSKPLSGRAPMKYSDGKLVVDEENWTTAEDKSVNVVLVPEDDNALAAGTYTLKVYPAVLSDLTVSMTDSHGCTALVTFDPENAESFTFEAGETYQFDASSAAFTKGYEMTLEGKDWAESDQVAVSLGSYSQTLTLVDSKVSMTLPAEVVHAESLTGIALYPASLAGSMQYTIPAQQDGTVAPELYSAAIDKDALVADSPYSVTMSKAVFATLRLLLPEGTKSVLISSDQPFAGTAPLKVEAGKLVVDRDSWSAEQLKEVTFTPSEGKTDVVVFPGTYTLKVTLTDADGCAIVKNLASATYSGETILDYSTDSFVKQYTVECTSDVAGPIMVAFGEDEPVEVVKDGEFVYYSHNTYTAGYAFYPTAAHTEGVSVPENQTADTAEPVLMYSELEFTAGVSQADFTNAFATLTITVPEGTTKVTLTSDTPLAGTMKVSGKKVVVDDTAESSNTLTVTGSGTTFKAYILPGTHTSLMAAIEDAEGTATKTFSKLTFESGKTSELDLVNGLRRPVTLNPAASVVHQKDASNVLTGSAVNFELVGTSAEEMARISNLNIEVISGGVVYKRYSSDNVDASSVVISDGDKHYLPQGSYSVNYSYSDDMGSYSGSITCTSPAPEYTLDLNFTATKKDVTIHSAKVKISEAVLAEKPLTANSNVLIRLNGSSLADFTTSIANGLSQPEFITNKTQSGAPYNSGSYINKYAVVCYFRFDNAEADVNYITDNEINGIYVTAVSNTYTKSAQISNANDLKDGGLYILCSHHNLNRYWYVDDSGNLKLSTTSPDLNSISAEYVFRYDVDNNQSIDMEDGYFLKSSVGSWYSVYRKMYMDTSDSPCFNLSSPQRYVQCGTGWTPNSGDGSFDISKGFQELLGYDSDVTEAMWGTNSTFTNQYWKWYIYEVIPE